MKKLRKSFFPLLLGLGFILGSFPTAHAQETNTDAFTLEEITITAEKREVNIQKTAMSVTAITGDEIEGSAILDLKSALAGMAGVNIMGIPGGGQVFIRGVGSIMDSNFGDPSVAVQLDNVYVGKTESMFSSMYDVERVEVLRGPQGTMYGRNATGGQVNVITKKPSDKFEANANLTIGDYNLKSFGTSINIPLSQKWAARIALNRESRDGYISDGSDSADKFAIRGKLSYKPTDKLSFLLTAEYTADKSSPANTVPVPGSAGKLPSFLPWVVPDANGDGVADDVINANGNDGSNGIADIVDTGWEIRTGGDAWSQDAYHVQPWNDNRFQLYTLDINYDLGWSILDITPTLNKNYRASYSEIIFGTSTGDNIKGTPHSETQWSGEARLQNADDSAIKWLVGMYWLKSNNRESAEATSISVDDLLSQSETYGQWVTQMLSRPSDTWAYYTQVTYPVTDRFRLTAGGRYTQDNKNEAYRIVNWDITDINDPFYDDATVIDSRHQYDSGTVEYKNDQKNISYKGGMEFDLNDSAMLYATVTTGFKGGGLNTYQYPVEAYKPEELLSYSIGSKNRFLNNKLQINAEAYYYDYKNYQIRSWTTVIDTFTGQQSSTQLIGNTGRSHNYGLDIDGAWMITVNDKLTFSAAFMKGEYGDYTLGTYALAGITEPFAIGGLETANSPTWSGTFGYEHTFDLADGGQLSTKLQTKISDGYWTTDEQFLAGAWQDRYHMSDLYVTYYSPSGKYTAGLWCKNLENTVVTTRTMPLYRRAIMSPRTTGVSLSVKF